MVRASPEYGSGSGSGSGSASGSPKRLTLGFLMSISSFMALFAKRARQVSSKLHKAKTIKSIRDCRRTPPRPAASPRSPLTARPKELLTTISNKAITFVHKRKAGEEKDDVFSEAHEEFGDGGVWQRAILMGDKCQPLDFSGVIYYDSRGKQLDEVPLRSPRASPLPGYIAREHEL